MIQLTKDTTLIGYENTEYKMYKDTYDIYINIAENTENTENTEITENFLEPDKLVGTIELKIYKDINTNLTFLLLPYIVIFEEYRNQYIASDIISSIVNLSTFQNETIHFIIGESTKNANGFWEKQLIKNNGFKIDYTFCMNTTYSFCIPTKHAKHAKHANNIHDRDILKKKQIITDLVPILLEHTYLDDVS